MTLMWGYPSGGRGDNIPNTLREINKLAKLLSQIKGKDLTADETSKLLDSFNEISGLGISTWSKLLYFFDVSLNSRKCQIYDLKIVNSLKKKQFRELGTQVWRHNNESFFRYLQLVNNLATNMNVLPEQVELFLFYFNLEYKFTS